MSNTLYKACQFDPSPMLLSPFFRLAKSLQAVYVSISCAEGLPRSPNRARRLHPAQLHVSLLINITLLNNIVCTWYVTVHGGNECTLLYTRKFSPISPVGVVGEMFSMNIFAQSRALCLDRSTHYFLEGSSCAWRNFCHNTKYEPLVKFLVSENFRIYGNLLFLLMLCAGVRSSIWFLFVGS